MWETGVEGGVAVGGKQGRLRSPFHLLHSEMKWPSQVCGGVGWREEGSGVLRHLIFPSYPSSHSQRNPSSKKRQKAGGEDLFTFFFWFAPICVFVNALFFFLYK